MKKYILLFLLISIFLVGCQETYKTDLLKSKNEITDEELLETVKNYLIYEKGHESFSSLQSLTKDKLLGKYFGKINYGFYNTVIIKFINDKKIEIKIIMY